MGKPAQRSRTLIDPRKSKRIGYWDGLTSLALVYTALVTPAEVALLECATSALEPFFMINRAVDAIFAFDMLVQCNLMIEIKSKDVSKRGTEWITKKNLIIKHYLKSWFIVDLASILVSAFDFMCFQFVQDMLGESAGGLGKLKILRVLRILRLVKLIRLLRASRMLKRWEQRLPINYAVLSLFKAIGTVILLAHWFACIWVLQAKIQDDMENTWMPRYGYCTPVVSGEASSGSFLEGGDSPTISSTLGPVVYECPPLQAYIASLYFAIMTITSIGYGDIVASKSNWVEQFICVWLMLTACVVWCQMIGVFSGVISSFNPEVNGKRSASHAPRPVLPRNPPL